MIEAMGTVFDGKAALVIAALLLLVLFERAAPAARPLSTALQEGRAWLSHRQKSRPGRYQCRCFLAGGGPGVRGGGLLGARLAPAWLAGFPGLAFDLFILDLWIYWWHRANHVVPLLWRFHVVHHLDEFLDATSALRFHAGEVLLSAIRAGGGDLCPGYSVGERCDLRDADRNFTMFHHSNVRLPSRLERLLSLLIVTPSIHWVHHHAIRRDTDSNYATVLSVWDRVFASRSSTSRTPDMPIGVESRHDLPFFQLLVRPWRTRDRR